jgi:hypothetical protein
MSTPVGVGPRARAVEGEVAAQDGQAEAVADRDLDRGQPDLDLDVNRLPGVSGSAFVNGYHGR